MTEEQIALARRAVAAHHWQWTRGMKSVEGGIFIAYTDCDEAFWLTHPDDGCVAEPVEGRVPDLSDPATLGCLLHLVRTAWHAPRALVRLSSDGRSFHVFDVDRVNPTGGNWAAWLSDDRCPSEAHALVDALTRLGIV